MSNRYMTRPMLYPLLKVVWRDSQQFDSVWSTITELDERVKKADEEEFVSVGYLVRESAGLLVLANSIVTDGEGDVTAVGHVFTIPKGCVVARTVLAKAEL